MYETFHASNFIIAPLIININQIMIFKRKSCFRILTLVLERTYLFVNERITKTKKMMISQQRYVHDVIQNKVQFIS